MSNIESPRCPLPPFGSEAGELQQLSHRRSLVALVTYDRTMPRQEFVDPALYVLLTITASYPGRNRSGQKDIFSNVSHKFRTRLAFILGQFDEAVAGRDNPIPREQQRIKIVCGYSLRFLDLVRNLEPVTNAIFIGRRGQYCFVVIQGIGSSIAIANRSSSRE
ncbi:hypothetical protein P6U16_25295 (plasmid) [Rhizobium sp. 32-5/1]|uniref:hypothetical protein n=1 Tax=Rhizobium sp. 32-5/1 TaxID=3019602 RepID=UPI00240E47CF|nr:hypothetical protein [Rhizobium sp. 32-5/1]WEZ85416.1 hypothetical protein P6U16_25295 [Rhizobium sp. 32-5/1]